jgi:hypothetical protein
MDTRNEVARNMKLATNYIQIEALAGSPMGRPPLYISLELLYFYPFCS